MRIEIEPSRFFAEATDSQTVVGISTDENCRPVLTLIDERTDESMQVVIYPRLLERLGAIIQLHNQWDRDQRSGSNVTAIECMRA